MKEVFIKYCYEKELIYIFKVMKYSYLYENIINTT